VPASGSPPAPDLQADLPIERYGLIGDSGTAALVSDQGSIDWLCLPTFDDAPVFGRLLDPEGGSCSISAVDLRSSHRRYLPETPILETTLRSATGAATLIDLFATATDERRDRELVPSRWLIRRLEGVEGVVTIDLAVAPRDPFGGGRWELQGRGRTAVAQLEGRALFIASSVPLEVRPAEVGARVEVAVGDVVHLCLAYAERDLGVVPPVGEAAEHALRDTAAYWRAWADRVPATSEHRDVVVRSALTLKLLSFAPSGGVVAAPTTSLPETLGGSRNWDYRSVWVRDASRSVIALLDRGHPEDARAYLFWIANATRLTRPRVDTLYALNGERAAREREIGGLRGYAGSLPVRTGNAAARQLQLDNWGYLVDAAYVFTERTGDLPWNLWPEVRSFVRFVVANRWRADHGIWEFRDRTRQLVHSKVMCWVALDRGIRLARLLSIDPPADWERARDEVHAAILRDGLDADGRGFARAFDDPAIDASLLELPAVGFLPGDDPRVLATIDRVTNELATGELVRRYRADDGLAGDEGAFVACSFWLVQALARAGRRAEAEEVFARTCARGNDLGLLPEEIDPATGAFLGNFPLALSHLGLLAAARALEDQMNGS
jgi:GH15 family glucan-1,4-alpha-glucosidase